MSLLVYIPMPQDIKQCSDVFFTAIPLVWLRAHIGISGSSPSQQQSLGTPKTSFNAIAASIRSTTSNPDGTTRVAPAHASTRLIRAVQRRWRRHKLLYILVAPHLFFN